MALIDNIVSYYKLDTNNSTQPDSAGSNDGTVSGGAVYTGSGKINGAYDFDGTDGKIDVDASLGTVHSASIWFNANATDGIVLGETGSKYFLYFVGGQIYYFDGTSFDNVAYVLPIGSWHHYVVTRNDQTLKFYVDGSQQGTTDTLTSNNAMTLKTIGTGATFYADGKIDEVGVWDGVLSDAEVTELYNSGSGLQYPFSSGPPLGTLSMMGVGR